MPIPRKKLIEVALPLEAINTASAREKSIRHGHPSTLHLWWARRPLAAARAVIFSQMVDDPGSVPEEFPTEEAQETERQRLFRLIEELVKWENTANETVMEQARTEIRRSWARWCRESGEDPAKLPPFHDPFAGGGALPLEAQRLGLEAHASDLNPVAVMINKAMIEIPPRFAGRPPVNPDARKKIGGKSGSWKGATGLAEDIRYYGQWMRDEAEKRIGWLYPKATLPDGSKATVIAWLWARTVESPNPAFRGCHVPLVSSFWLSTKPGKLAWVEPIVEGREYHFHVRTGTPEDKAMVDAGTKLGRGANFRCVLSQSPISPNYIRSEAQAGRMSARLMAVVAQGNRSRHYLAPNDEQERAPHKAKPEWKPDQKVTTPCHDVDRLPMYGMFTWGDAFTPRQLVALTTFSDLVAEAREKIRADAISAGLSVDAAPLHELGSGATAYGEAVSVFLAFAIGRLSDLSSTISTWIPNLEAIRGTFGRQAIPMTWDYCECNPVEDKWSGGIDWITRVVELLPMQIAGTVFQADAAKVDHPRNSVISTDPPYYDNIGYADLSDYFYVWMRRILYPVFSDLFGTLLVPKADELIASPYRHGSKQAAESFFLKGMTNTMHGMAERSHRAFPVTVYYAFKQSEKEEGGTASTGWETFLEAVIQAGFSVTGTWPMRTERGVKLIGENANILASSIILVCRPLPDSAPISTRKDFLATLRRELPSALHHLQEGNIAPVDLAQASIGPGMAVYTRYTRILESDGTPMPVRSALQIINQLLDEVLAEQEGAFDAETGWAVAWFDQFGFHDGPFGEAETLSKAKNSAVNALEQAGIIKTGSGKVRLFRPEELPADWNPLTDKRLTVWETTHHLIRALNTGEAAAAALATKLGSAAEPARELAYRLYAVCERRKRSTEAQDYNALVQAWGGIRLLANERTTTERRTQTEMPV